MSGNQFEYGGRIVTITRPPGRGMNYQASLGNSRENFLTKLYKSSTAAREAARKFIDDQDQLKLWQNYVNGAAK